MQDSGAPCPLRSVCFLNAHDGWAAGGTVQPYLHTSSGVLLATRDGGRHWYRDRGLLLPALKRIGFFDAKHGWAVGDSSPLFPSGVFSSRDGGRSWGPLSGGNSAGWTTGDCFDEHTALLAGRNAVTAAVCQGDWQAGRAGGLDLETLRQLRLVGPPYAWLVGDGGTVLLTADLGGHWRRRRRGPSPPTDRHDGLRRFGRPRPEVLDRRLAGQPPALHGRRRPHVERLCHSHPAAAFLA